MKHLLRILIGLIFIISGAVKAIDPMGFSFKLEEYFSPSVFNMPWLEPFALYIAIFVVVLEILLGVMLVLGTQLKFTLFSLIGLCVFFGFLTFYSAYFNKVTDCGCFGDAIKFTPWQSFFKDVALLIGLIFLYFLYRNATSLALRHPISIGGMGIVSIAMGIVIYWGIAHEPIVDFRAYKIGTDMISEKKKINANPDEYRNIYTLKNTKTQEEKRIPQDEYLENDTYWKEGTPWEILSDKTTTELVKEGYASEIKKFKIEKNGIDITEEILNQPKAYLLFAYQPTKLNEAERIKAQNAIKNQSFAMAVTTVPNSFTEIPEALMDGIAIKTIARSNPFILVLENGKIVDKKALKDFKLEE